MGDDAIDVTVNGNTVGLDMQIEKNGDVIINGAIVRGDLQCKDNRSLARSGTITVADGRKDECPEVLLP